MGSTITVATKQLGQWLHNLDNDDFEVRQSAGAALEKFGDRIEAALQKASTENRSLESKRRIEALLAGIEISPDRLRGSRALEALEQIATPEAAQLLEALAAGAPAARLTREAAQSLERMRRR